MSGLTGQTALVTGASRGIGRYTAQRLARDGARVGVHYGTNEAAAKDTVASIEAAGGSAFAVQADLAVPHAAEALWAAFDEHADGLDILVNNAGVVVYGRVNEVAEEDFDRLFAVNVKAVLFIVQHGLHRLRDGARIINLSSAGAYMASPMATMYTMTKGAVSTLTRTLAWDLGDPQGDPIPVPPGGPARYNPIHEDDFIATLPRLLDAASVPATTVNWCGEQTVSLLLRELQRHRLQGAPRHI